MPPVPSATTRSLLLKVVDAWQAIVKKFRTGGGLPSFMASGILTTAVVASSRHELPTDDTFARYPVTPTLEQLLQTDQHLRAACRTVPLLARALEVILLDQLTPSPAVVEEGGSLNARITDYLIARLFEDDYKRAAFFRFYNLTLEEAPFAPSPLDASFQIVPDHRVPQLTGESTQQSTLHRSGTGNVFLVFEDRESDEEAFDWWKKRWGDANLALQVMRYLKYGVIDVDYSVIHYMPAWLNSVRRYGIGLWGTPRAETQDTYYTLSKGEESTLSRYLVAALALAPAVADLTPSLRRATSTAGNYYEGHHRRKNQEDQLIDLAVALEALFSPSDKVELSFRISLTAALLLGATPQSRKDISGLVKKAYACRSQLIHSGKSPFEGGKFTQAELYRLADLVRQAILRLLILYLRGETDRNQLLERIVAAAFDGTKIVEIQELSDVGVFLTQRGL